jgi:hypothetical protein
VAVLSLAGEHACLDNAMLAVVLGPVEGLVQNNALDWEACLLGSSTRSPGRATPPARVAGPQQPALRRTSLLTAARCCRVRLPSQFHNNHAYCERCKAFIFRRFVFTAMREQLSGAPGMSQWLIHWPRHNDGISAS